MSSNTGGRLDITYLLVDAAPTLDSAPVLQSQVLDWLGTQRQAGIAVGLVTTVEDPGRFARLVQPVLQDAGIEWTSVRAGRLAPTLLRSARALRRFARSSPSPVVYVRGIWGTAVHALAYPRSGPRLVYDFRGDIVEEAAYRGAGRPRQAILRRLVSFALRRADIVICVSATAADALKREYGREVALVVPSCVDAARFALPDTDREMTRAELGVRPSDVLLVYSGGMASYQLVPEMLRLWATLETDPATQFLMLVSDAPAPDVGGGGGLPIAPSRLRRMSVPRSQVPRYLNAADIGFLLRDAHPLNRVASPVKFGEYLASGLAVVASPGIGETSSLVADRRLGELVDGDDQAGAVTRCRALIEAVRRDRAVFRHRAHKVVAEVLDWSVYVPAWKQLLGLPQ